MGLMSPFQGFLAQILILVSNIAMLILLVRFLAAPYLYIDAGPILQGVNQAAMRLCRPFRGFCWWFGFRGRDVSPFAAILVILVLRGLLLSLISVSSQTAMSSTDVLIRGQQASFILCSHSLLKLTAAVLFAWVMLTRAGGFYSGIFFRIVEDVSSAVFHRVRRVIRVKSLWGLLAGAFVAISAAYALAVCVILLNPLFPLFWAYGFLEAVSVVIWLVMILSLVYIAISWISLFAMPEPSNRFWLMLQAMVRPALDRTHRMFPWARVGLLDLSPLILFFGLWLGLLIINAFQVALVGASRSSFFGAM